MKRYFAICIIFFMLSGCAQNNKVIDQAVSLRKTILNGKGCSFLVTVTADYQDVCYIFGLNCDADAQGNIHFEVTSPDSIMGIKGIIAAEGGKLTFDDQALLFSTMIDGQISPVCAPWIFLKTMRNGYIDGCAQEENGLLIQFVDTLFDKVLRVNIQTRENVPAFAEIICDERRILTMEIENFRVL